VGIDSNRESPREADTPAPRITPSIQRGRGIEQPAEATEQPPEAAHGRRKRVTRDIRSRV